MRGNLPYTLWPPLHWTHFRRSVNHSPATVSGVVKAEECRSPSSRHAWRHVGCRRDRDTTLPSDQRALPIHRETGQQVPLL